MTAPCSICPHASRDGDPATGVCQNAFCENYARRLHLVTACTYVPQQTATRKKKEATR